MAYYPSFYILAFKDTLTLSFSTQVPAQNLPMQILNPHCGKIRCDLLLLDADESDIAAQPHLNECCNTRRSLLERVALFLEDSSSVCNLIHPI